MTALDIKVFAVLAVIVSAIYLLSIPFSKDPADRLPAKAVTTLAALISGAIWFDSAFHQDIYSTNLGSNLWIFVVTLALVAYEFGASKLVDMHRQKRK